MSDPTDGAAAPDADPNAASDPDDADPAAPSDSPRVRVRGIYATALTALLSDAGLRVVQASPPIRDRFDESFPAAPHDVAVSTTADRQGVDLSGAPDAVDAVADSLRDVAVDTFAWTDPAPRDAAFRADVVDTVRGGAVLDLGGRDGYLPFSRADDHVAVGDTLRVQVADPAPPWSDDRPLLDTTLRVSGGLASLVAGVDSLVVGSPDGTPEHELVRLTETLGTAVPDGWGVDWHRGADGADLAALDATLASLADRAQSLDAALDDAGGRTGRLASPLATSWVWFGRDARFALDEVRGGVVPTMAGHHRVKAAHEAASHAVDFVERLCPPVESFPFGAVADQFGPAVGDRVAIEHGKPDGRLVTLGRGEVTDRDDEAAALTLRREMSGGGTYDALDVPREAGDVAVTRFREGRWWYPTVYRSAEGGVKGTYVNVSTPVELFPDAVRYVDLHVDVVKHANGTVEVVDEAELAAAVEAGHVSSALADRARDVADRVARSVGD